jgi:hypothetical protein
MISFMISLVPPKNDISDMSAAVGSRNQQFKCMGVLAVAVRWRVVETPATNISANLKHPIVGHVYF